MKVKKIKLFDPVINTSEEKEVIKIIKSGHWASGAGNKKVLQFEKEFQKYLGSDECIAVNSGTAALHLALSLFDIKNKEVILPSLSFVSTAHSIVLNGGIPKFVDVDPKTCCIDLNEIKKSISKKTVAILPVHFAGMPCDMNGILDICKKNNLELIEDAAHASGTKFEKQKIGTHGTVFCFSFHPVKNLAMLTGGLISINHKKHKKFKKILNERRWCGITNRKGFNYDVQEIGWNYYMNEMSAGLGILQLKKLDRLNKIRSKIAKRYHDEIEIDEKMPYEKDCSYHFYWIRVNDRENIMKKLKKEGIETGIHYRPIHTMSMYNKKTKLPVTEKIGKEIMSIPTHPNLTNNEITKIISKINKFCR